MLLQLCSASNESRMLMLQLLISGYRSSTVTLQDDTCIFPDDLHGTVEQLRKVVETTQDAFDLVCGAYAKYPGDHSDMSEEPIPFLLPIRNVRANEQDPKKQVEVPLP